MTSFVSKSLCILGRQPALGLAELESLYGADHIRPIGGAALLDIDVNEIDFKRLGGTVKIAKILNILPTGQWSQLEQYLAKTIPEHLKYVPEGKFTLGVSVYNLGITPKTINDGLLRLKKIVKSAGRPARVIPNKTPALNSAQVLHNKLTSKGAWELLFIGDGDQTILAQTMFVQDIEAYAARDQVRPKRDAHIGMLPPKLAQIIINLANPPREGWTLDPFCGTGVVLQEALLIGFKVVGSDLDARMVSFAEANVEWLKERHENLPEAEVIKADATSFEWPEPVVSVASEVYLGPPLTKPGEINGLAREIGGLLNAFLKNLSPQLNSGARLSLAIPAWHQPSNKTFVTPTIGKLTEMGYNHIKFQHAADGDLIYWRQGQVVGRKLIVLEKV